MIIAGAIMMVIGFCGCLGAVRESQCLLSVFFVLLFLVFALCVAIIVIVLVAPHLTDNVTKPVRDRNGPSERAGLFVPSWMEYDIGGDEI